MQTATDTKTAEALRKPTPTHYPTGDVMRAVVASLTDSLYDAGVPFEHRDNGGRHVFVRVGGFDAAFVAGREAAYIQRVHGDTTVHPLAQFEAEFMAEFMAAAVGTAVRS